MKRIARYFGVLPLLSLAGALSLPAATVYTTTLSPGNEVPPTNSTASGTASLTLSSDQLQLTVDLSFTGLTGAAAAGHIHCCVAPGGNAAVALPFTGLPNATSGTYTNTFTLASPGVLINGVTAQQLIAGLNAGTAYVNIHTPANPNGEIRGFVTATPEPGTAALMLLPLGAGAWLLRRRKEQVA